MQPVDDGDDQSRLYPLERLGANLNPGQRLGCPAALLCSGLKGCSGSDGLLSARNIRWPRWDHNGRRPASPSHSNESRVDTAMVDFVLGRYAGPTTFNEARRGLLGGQSCRRNSAVARHVLTEAITVSCHRVSRSNCDAVTNRPVAHPLLGPCHTLSDTVIGLAPCGSTDRLSTNSRFGAPCCRSLAHATAPSSTGFRVLLTLQRTGRDCGAFAIQFVDENRRHPVCSRRA
jgi:hypothetical protein